MKAIIKPVTIPVEIEGSITLKNALTEAGFTIQSGLAGIPTAFSGSYGSGKPVIGFLGEFDALSGLSQEAGITEKKPIAEGGNGHGCGHNLHGALSVLSGLGLMELKDSFKGKLYVIGTPAEEENGAKIGMAQQGIFDDMALAAMMHSTSGGLSVPDMDELSLRCYVVDFHGKTAHAVGAPWEGRSALAAGK